MGKNLDRRDVFQEIAKMGHLIGGACVLTLALLYIWASAFFSRPVSLSFLWHQLTSRWFMLVVLIVFVVFFLLIIARLMYLITHVTSEVFFAHKWRMASKEKKELEKNLKQFYSALKRVHIPLAITKRRKIIWSNHEMNQLVQKKLRYLSDLSDLFPKTDLSQKLSSITRRLTFSIIIQKRFLFGRMMF